MEPDALVEILKRDNASKFLEEHIFDRVPHVFNTDRSLFVGWKRTLAEARKGRVLNNRRSRTSIGILMFPT